MESLQQRLVKMQHRLVLADRRAEKLRKLAANKSGASLDDLRNGQTEILNAIRGVENVEREEIQKMEEKEEEEKELMQTTTSAPRRAD